MNQVAGQLAGRRVLIGRSGGHGRDLIAALERAGAEVATHSLIAHAEPSDPAAFARAVQAVARGEYGWVVLTSPAAAGAFLTAGGGELGPSTRVAAVGAGTARRVSGRLPVDLVGPEPASGQALVQAFAQWRAAHRLDAGPVLCPRSDLASPVVPEGLRELGYRVDEVEAYRTVPRRLPEPVLAELTAGAFDVVVVYSGSAASSLAQQCADLPAALVCLGEPSAAAARRLGLPVAQVAASANDDGVFRAVVAACEQMEER